MNSGHDVGGMHGFEEIPSKNEDSPFHEEWQKQAMLLNMAMLEEDVYNVDEFRHARERIPPARFLNYEYYQRVIEAMEMLLVETGQITEEELREKQNQIMEASDRAFEHGAV